jgi:dihydrofolate reductase
MKRIIAFTLVSVDGYFTGPNGEIDWFMSDKEDQEFSSQQSKSTDTLIFGRTTYEMMAGYWPTPEAVRDDPGVAGILNTAPKIVFSKSMKPVKDGPVWKNVTVLHEINPEEIRKMKEQGEGDMAILGSGTIVQQFANFGLIDEYGLLVIPVVLGAGKYLFKDVNRINLKRIETRTFRNGKVFLRYVPV